MTNVDNDMDIFTQALSSVIDRNCDRDIANGIVAIHGFALARAEAAEAERNTAARRAFNAEADNQRLTAENRRLAARVAELEAQLAAQGWRPVTENPPREGRYLVWCPAPWPGYEIAPYDRGWGYIDLRFTHWQPLPPAPDAQEPTP